MEIISGLFEVTNNMPSKERLSGQSQFLIIADFYGKPEYENFEETHSTDIVFIGLQPPVCAVDLYKL